MFCPKCGIENPDNGKFCRKCGIDLKLFSDAMSGKLSVISDDKNGMKSSWEAALVLLFSSFAFFTISIILAFQPMGAGWWFWLLIPAFGALGLGSAQVIALKQKRQDDSVENPSLPESEMANELPPKQTKFVSNDANGKVQTRDLVPSSVVESTTRKLEMDSEGEPMNQSNTE